MPIYEFQCPNCGARGESVRVLGDNDPPACPDCGITTRRRYSPVAFKMPLQDHYNIAAGAYVTGQRDLEDRFKVMSEQTSLRTGMDHKFVPVDPADSKEEFGVTDEGLDATYRARHAQSQSEVKRWL